MAKLIIISALFLTLGGCLCTLPYHPHVYPRPVPGYNCVTDPDDEQYGYPDCNDLIDPLFIEDGHLTIAQEMD